MLVGVVAGSPSSTASSLIETSITVPAVNAAFYACARAARPYLVAIGRYSFGAKEFIPITSSAGCCSFQIDLTSTRVSAARDLRHVPFTPRAIFFHYSSVYLRLILLKKRKLEFFAFLHHSRK